MAADHRETSRRVFEEIWNQKNLNAVDELMAENYVHHDPSSPRLRVASMATNNSSLNTSTHSRPALHLNDQVAAGEIVVSRWTATGTHSETCRHTPNRSPFFGYGHVHGPHSER